MPHVPERAPRCVPSRNSTCVGRHLLADMYGVDASALGDADTLRDQLTAALRTAGFHIIEQHTHRFPGAPSGVTAFVLLSESHAAVHTYPEHEYLALDVFSCGPADPRRVLDALCQYLRPRSVDLVEQTRGDLDKVKMHAD